MDKETEKLVKASLIAGLKLFGQPNVKTSIKGVREFCKRFNININKFEKVTHDSGLLWDWYEDGKDPSKIIKENISDRLKEQLECFGIDDPRNLEFALEYPVVLDDFEYIFKPDGTGYDDMDGAFEKKYRYNNKLHTYYDCRIYIYEMDLDSVEEARKLITEIHYKKRRTR